MMALPFRISITNSSSANPISIIEPSFTDEILKRLHKTGGSLPPRLAEPILR